MNVTAIGRTRILLNTIYELAAAGHTIERIVTCEASDFYEVSVGDFRELATELDAAFLVPEDINDPDLVSTFRDSDSSLAASVNWRSLLQRSVLEAFNHGIVNGHAGDLPRYRGNAAPNWAIINGEDEIVLTVHLMTEDLDTGPILYKRIISIDDSTYIGDIYDEMYDQFPELFLQVVEDAAAGDLNPHPQPSDPAAALRGYPRKPIDSKLQWEKSAECLARVVRASAEPLFGAYTWLNGRRLRVWRARSEHPPHEFLGTPGQVAERRPDKGEVAVITGNGFLVLESVQREGTDVTRRQPTEIIQSNRTRLGMDLTSTVAELREETADLHRRLDDLCDEP
jgi:methionyl-tRNA formyltransferase